MRSDALSSVLAAAMVLAGMDFARGASVGPAGYATDFGSQPVAGDWATISRAGGATDNYDMDADVNASVTAAGITTQVGASANSPPAAGGSAVWSSSGLYLQTRPTQVRYVALMGTFINDTGSNVAQVAISYDFTIADGGVSEESGRGTRVYYSLSGLPGSWINLPRLNSASSVDGRISMSTNIAVSWGTEGSLYLLWVDDNSSASGGADPANQIDNFSLAVTESFPLGLACRLDAPLNNAAFVSGAAVNAASTVLFGTGGYTVEYFTNSGAGNTIFASAGSVSAPSGFELELGTRAPGTYNIYAVATQSGPVPAGATSATNSFYVVDPLMVTLESPVQGATFEHVMPVSGVVTIVGGSPPYSVQFFLDNSPGGAPVTSPPYERDFGALFVGDHMVYATVTDTSGWVSNSAAHTIHISGPLAVTFSPADDSVFFFGQPVTLSALIGGGTAPYTATFYTNGQPAGTVASAPFVLNLGLLAPGIYSGYVHVIDGTAPVPEEAHSSTNVFIVEPNTLFVSLTQPDDGDVALEGSPLTLSAFAFVDAPLTVSNVQFFYEDTLVGMDTSEPYSFVLTTHTEGTRRIYAAAIDSLGRRSYSTTNQIRVVGSGPAPNDAFENAIALGGPVAAATGNNLTATRQPGEPNHAVNNPGGGSLWWTWTPSTSGPATIDTFGSSFDTLLGVYLGNAVNALTVIAQNDDFSGLQSRVQFNATAGPLYRIAVDGYSGSRGLILLNIRGAGGIVLDAPTNGMVVTVGDPITVAARILPDFPDPPLSRVEFYRNGSLFASIASEPISVIASNVPAGSNTFYVVAYNSEGLALQSSSATVFVQAIGVMILTPRPDTTFSTTNPITINAWAYLPEGSITNVEFFVDGLKIGEDGLAGTPRPAFSAVWSNVIGGSHRLTAVGHSDSGAAYLSEAVNIGVVHMFVPFGSVWRYRDDGSNQGTNWSRLEFDDSSWPSGPAPLGYGDSGGRFPATVNASGFATIYYRHSFVVSNAAGISYLDMRLERDDGAIVYLNGQQIHRDFNMPSGTVSYTDYTLDPAFDDGEIGWGIFSSGLNLLEGTNTLAVEVHQDGPGATDSWMRMSVAGYPIIIQNLPPVASIINPTNNQYYLAPPNITLEAEAFDPESTVELVEFFADGVKIGETNNVPYSIVWELPPIGAHVITARATDDEGASALSQPVVVVVYDAAGTPLTRITSPADGAVMEGPTNLLVTAVAHAITGVANVQFLANGEVFGEDNSAPYSAVWAAPFGTNLLTTTAFDANGATGTSAVVTVTITIPPTNVIPPVIIRHLPVAESTVTNLTNITVSFSEYVQNVHAADLLINGVPATSVDGNHSRSNFTFAFPHPAYGRVNITWAPGHGITDYGWPAVLPFDEAGEGASWTYMLVDQTPPTIAARTPAPGSIVTNLSQITVTFSEAVTGVDAADLRINASPAVEMSGSGSNYVFRFAQPPPGNISVGWATNHDIFDLAPAPAGPNPFDRAGGTWSFVLDTRTVLLQSNSMWRFVKGTNEPSVPMTAWRQPNFDDSGWSNSPAPFFYGDPYNSPQNPGTWLNDMLNDYTTLYLRTEFTVLNRALITNLWLNAQSDDGFIAWLNGVEIRRYNAPPGDPPYTARAATASPEPQARGAAYILASLPNAVAALVDGRNVLAVQGFNQLPTSSDFGFNAQLYTYPVDLTTFAPGLLPAEPPQGDVFYLTNITITFTEPVRGVDTTDLLVNGVPATALSTAGDRTYIFSFPQPPFGPVLITWDANHGIVDFDPAPAGPRAFDGAAPTSVLAYHLVNPSSPRILTQVPLGGSSLTGLTAIVVTFDEPVSGVDAADLLVSGAPSSSLSSSSSSSYTFSFAQPPFGFVPVRWAANHGIVDVEGGNAFDPTRFGGQWNYTLIDPAPSVTITNPTDGSYALEPATVTITANASDHDGMVARVEFYQNGNLLGEDAEAPYSVVWSEVLLGAYVLTAIAIDDMGLRGTSAPVVLNVVTSLPAMLVRGPYLQVGTPTSGIVRWRTDVVTDGVVYYGTDPLNLTSAAVESAVTNEHIVQLSGLEPDTRYYYSVGSAAQRLAGTNGVNSDFWFNTSPPPGQARRTRIWVLGDPGTATSAQQRTREAFYNFAATNGPADLWLMLGDNAYGSGTDAEYQRAVFNLYPATLRNLFLWPAIGNHDTAQSFTAMDFPYLHIFSLPRDGEAGGVSSGTEKYYSFDYANIHFVCLDSMTSGHDANTAMAEWLRADLAAVTAHWVIVYFHHPPYTKGNHDSDRERELIEIRQNLVPIMEEHGVDLVLCGHSHAWERSYLLHGHYGFSSTLTDSMKIDGGDGREDGTGAYRKNEAGQGVVYTVAGNAGQVTGGSLNHPAHYVSFNELGTMVIDVDGNRLDAIFLREDSQVPDRFTLMKANPRPDAPLHLVATPTGAAEVRLDWTDAARNELGYSIERSTDGVNFAEHLTAAANAESVLDTGLTENVTYFYRVRGTNTAGVSDYSNIAGITAGIGEGAVPPAPANLVAVAQDGVQFYRSRMILTWEDRSSSEAGFQIERSQDALLFLPVGTVAANVSSYLDQDLASASHYVYRVRAINSHGLSDPSNPAASQTHPQSQIVRAGESVSFHAGVEGAPPVSYQWRFMGDLLPDETNETLTLPAAELSNQGEYSVLITHAVGSHLSNPAMLVVVSPPRILSQPEDYVRGVGMSVEFSVEVEGTPPFTYHWRRAGRGVPAEPIGASAPTLSLPNVAFSDQGGYDVLIANDFGSATSRVATLRVYALPVLAPVPDLFAEVLKVLVVTNVVTDENVPPLDLRFALGPDSPTNAIINATNGLLRWTPNRSQAPGVYPFTVTVFDPVNPILSDSTTFNVQVNDYAELSAGSNVIAGETNGLVTISLFSSLPLAEIRAVLNFQGTYFTSVSLEPLQAATPEFQRLDANTAALTFTAPIGGALLGTNQVGLLRLATAPITNSAAVPLRLSALSASTLAAGPQPTLLAADGQVIVVGARPLLHAGLTPQGAREVTIFGRPGIYPLQWATNLVNPVWRLRGNVSVNSNLSGSVRPGNTPPTNMPGFFRTRQQ